jgi:hypothetical protein
MSDTHQGEASRAARGAGPRGRGTPNLTGGFSDSTTAAPARGRRGPSSGFTMHCAEGMFRGRLQFWDSTSIIIKFLRRRKFSNCLYFKADPHFIRAPIAADREPDRSVPSRSTPRMQPSLASVAAQPVASRDTPGLFEAASPSHKLHPQWHVRFVLLLVAFLHTRHHVSFKACGLILLCLNFIFSALPGILSAHSPCQPLYRLFFPASA